MVDLSFLPTISETVRSFGLRPKKSLGQNFLFDLSLTRKIARLLPDIRDQEMVLEIGPGPGALTRALVIENKLPLTLIEKDARFIKILGQLQEHVSDLFIHEADALQQCYRELAGNKKMHIAANLPYNIAQELLVLWCAPEMPILTMALMFQKEVAQRLCAHENSKPYGRLSVLAQNFYDVTLCFDIAPSAFYPPPKVTSSVVKFVAKANTPSHEVHQMLMLITKHAFGQRRKMLRSSLKGTGISADWWEAALREVDAKMTDRAENLSPLAYKILAEKVLKRVEV